MRDVILFLDDMSERAVLAHQRMNPEDRRSTFWCTTVAEAINILDEYRDRLYQAHLDHDLAGPFYQHSGSEESGMEAVRFLEKQNSADYDGCVFVIHTHNPYAGQKMTERLEAKGYKVIRRPFGM